MNHKDERIHKLWLKGTMTVEQIARKIGYGNPPKIQGLWRVLEALERKGVSEKQIEGKMF